MCATFIQQHAFYFCNKQILFEVFMILIFLFTYACFFLIQVPLQTGLLYHIKRYNEKWKYVQRNRLNTTQRLYTQDIVHTTNLLSLNPSSNGKLEAFTISDHDLSVSHSGAGLGYGLSKATPPVSRKCHTSSSTSFLQKETNQTEIKIIMFTLTISA